VVGDGKLGAAEIVPVAAQFRHGGVDRKQRFGRDRAQGHEDFRPDGRNLAHQEWGAGFALVSLRSSVAGRAALDDVCDVDIFATQAHGLDHIVEKLPSAAYEGFALGIFIRARGFADEHKLGSRIAYAEDDLFAALLVQAAAGAIAQVFANGEQGLGWIGYGGLGSGGYVRGC